MICNSGAVETLLILGGNPVYDAPADFSFLDALKKVKFRAHLGLLFRTRPRRGATGTCPRRITWNPGATRAPTTGRRRIVQPLIAPLYGGKIGARRVRMSC